MPIFSAYEGLPFADQLLHGAHFMLCSFAVLIAFVPLMTIKGSTEHKFAGLIYLPLSLAALLLASFMAWRETSAVLFCFNCFCAYLLMSGWRAVHEHENPKRLDWFIPGSLFVLAVGVTIHALINDQGLRTFYLLFFAMNAFFLSWRDWKHLRQRRYWSEHKIFFADTHFNVGDATAWIGRHVTGMVGSLLANFSVVALTLLPLELHWLWPTSLLLIGAYVAWREREKKLRIRAAIPPVLQPKFHPVPAARKHDENIRRAA